MMDVAIRAAARPGRRRLVYSCAVLTGVAAGLVTGLAAGCLGAGSKTKRITWRDGETSGVNNRTDPAEYSRSPC